jgi:hypothetical protein
MLKPVLTLAALIGLAASAEAGDRYAAPPPSAGYRYYGTVNNYYGPVTVYAAPGGGQAPAYYPAYPANGSTYGYATAPECDANCYGAGYNWSGGYSSGGGYAYPNYGYRYYGYPPANQYQRLDPWAGYNGGWGNGYW